jgi:hypothetical protein
LREFRDLQKALGDNAILGVHFFTYPHFSYNPYAKQDFKDCLGSGLYCIRPGKSGVNLGSYIVRESIVQKCIYNYAYENKGKKNKRYLFWNYIQTFQQNCINIGKIDTSCSESVLNDLKIPIKDIQKCYEESFIGEKNEKNYEIYSGNSIFDTEYELRKKNFISKSPSITINERV